MPRKGENIYKRKDGRWEGRYIKCYDVRGKAQYGYVYGKTYSEVKQLLKENQNKVSRWNNLGKHIDPTYEDVITAWLESQRLHVKESTYSYYYQIVHTHLIPDIGSVKLNKISAGLIEKYASELIESGRIDGTGGLSSKTVNDILTIIKATFRYAARNNYPIDIDLDQLYIKRKKNEMRVLSVEEQKKLTLTLMNDTDLYKFGVLLSLYTGIRIGELCALKWEDLHLDEGILSVKKTMMRIKDTSGHASSKTKIVITEPKSKCSVRDIPLPPFIVSVARNFQAEKSAFVLTCKSSRYVEPRTMQNRFKSLVRESGIEDANFHALRHTFATRCIEIGFDLKTLSDILGHTDVNITLNRYIHSSFDMKRKNMNKLSQYFDL